MTDNLPPMEFKDRCTVAVECLPNAPYRTMLANLLDEMLAAIERQSVPAGYVRFCPECGTTGEVRPTARDCCPDGSHAAYMPEKTAEVCSKIFHDLLAAAPQPQPVQQEPVAHCELTKAGSIAFFDGRPMVMVGPVWNECHPHPLYTSPQAAQPLSDAETRSFALGAGLIRKADELRPTTWGRIVRFKKAIEHAHGITKGTT